MNIWIGGEQRLHVDALEDRAIAGRQPGQCVAEQVLLPVPDRSHAVHEDEPSHRGLVAFDAEHCEATAPRVAENIPRREPDRLAQCGEVAGVVLDARATGTGRNLRFTAPALVVENDLPALGEWRERGPQQVVVEQQTTIDADERRGTAYFRGEVHGEVEPACPDGAPSEARRSGA